jgi:WD40 repeat protein
MSWISNQGIVSKIANLGCRHFKRSPQCIVRRGMIVDRTAVELSILISHYIRDKNPEVYANFSELCRERGMLPEGVSSMEEALDVRHCHLPPDQFSQFLKTLTPNDDYPSLFRRMTSFGSPRTASRRPSLDFFGSWQAHHDPIYSLAFDPLSRFLLSGSDDGLIKMVSIPDFNEIHVFRGHEGLVTNISIHPNVSYLLSSSHDATARLWSLNTGECLTVLDDFTKQEVQYATFSPTGAMFATGGEDGSLCLWNTSDALRGEPPFATLTSPDSTPILWISFSPGSEFVVFSAEPNHVIVSSIGTSKQQELKYHASTVPSFRLDDCI